MPSGRFYFFIFILAFLFAGLYFVVMYIISSIKKKAIGKVETIHDFEDEKAEIDVEALKIKKAEELRQYRKEKLGEIE